ncbi:hypothetical protein M408DRAFT_26046 [Serendipita vermifera MAFF 305830]|uniref:F-box domain-containing protein n=1 Tax=Serendipita vermifera MAFF 305830 TaxID=933852 RepID=A0A0C3B2I6_SERVB|nr:hypothetical protein M408DRAFT_26046 [Serendipita vermifera MAFF 305830]
MFPSLAPNTALRTRQRRLMKYGPGYMNAFFGSRFILQSCLKQVRRKDFNDLFTDVILEIFQHYVAVQSDGPYILMLVSNLWRDLVIKAPSLWQWITFDSNCGEQLEKAFISATFAGSCPLQVILKLPSVACEASLPYIFRCQNLFIEVPDYMDGNEVRDDTQVLMSALNYPGACKIHWGRADEDGEIESREPFATPMPHVEVMNIESDGSGHFRYRYYVRNKDPQWRYPQDPFHPLVLLKIYRILDVLRNTSNLRTLVISHHAIDPRSSDIALPEVTLSNLQSLTISDLNNNLNGPILPLIGSIKCPNLANVELSGEFLDILAVTCELHSLGTPTSLDLHLFSCLQDELPSIKFSPFRLDFIGTLIMRVEKSLFWTYTHINDLINAVNNASVVRLDFSTTLKDWSSSVIDLKCLHSLSHDDSMSPSGKGKVNQMDSCRFLKLSRVGVLRLPERNRIQILDINFRYRSEVPSCWRVLPCSMLTTLVCTPSFLLPFLTDHLLPALHTIQLHLPYPVRSERFSGEGELDHFDTKITGWFIEHHDPFPCLRTFALAWFPAWRSFLEMINSIARNLGRNIELSIKLPSIPGRLAQHGLAFALGGSYDAKSVFIAQYKGIKQQLEQSTCLIILR